MLQGALLGASERRMQVKQIRPILWNVVEEARARRAGLKTLRLGLLGLTLTDERLSQMGRALRELQVSKVRLGAPGPAMTRAHSKPFCIGGKSLGPVPKKPSIQRGQS